MSKTQPNGFVLNKLEALGCNCSGLPRASQGGVNMYPLYVGHR